MKTSRKKPMGTSQWMTRTRNKRPFTLLEIMIGIAILAIASGSVFWRLHQMVEKRRFESDLNRLRSMLLSSRSLAINTQMDYRLELKEAKEGWLVRLICREDPDRNYRLPHFSGWKFFFDRKPIQELTLDFFSTGFVAPKGLLTLSQSSQPEESQKREIKIPDLFYRQEDGISTPLHPDDENELL